MLTSAQLIFLDELMFELAAAAQSPLRRRQCSWPVTSRRTEARVPDVDATDAIISARIAPSRHTCNATLAAMWPGGSSSASGIQARHRPGTRKSKSVIVAAAARCP